MELRTRSRGALSNSWTRKQDYNPPSTGGALTVDIVYPSTSKHDGKVETITDVKIPNFAKLRANGAVFMNPVTITKDSREGSDGEVYSFGPHPGWGTRVVTGACSCVWSVPPSRPSWFNTRIEDAQARTLLSAHAKVAQENFLAMVTVAESGKTARMIASPFAQADELITRIATRKAALVKKGMLLGAAATAAWLESRFGWKPLLYEMQGIWDSYIQNTSSFDKPTRLVARAGDKDIHWSSGGVTDVLQLAGCNAKMSAEYEHEARVSSGVLYELWDESLADATARRMGLRLSDVPSSLWEATPLSFVVDRFVDVGKWLNAIVPKPGVTIKGSWTTTIVRERNFHKVVEAYVQVNTPPATRYSVPGGTYKEDIQYISRVPNPSLPPLPTVNYRDLTLTQQIDHAALIVQRLLGLGVGNSRI